MARAGFAAASRLGRTRLTRRPTSLQRTEWTFLLHLYGNAVARSPSLEQGMDKLRLFAGPAFILDEVSGDLWVRMAPAQVPAGRVCLTTGDPNLVWCPLDRADPHPRHVNKGLAAKVRPRAEDRPRRMPAGVRLPYKDD